MAGTGQRFGARPLSRVKAGLLARTALARLPASGTYEIADGVSGADNLLGTETQGLAIDFVTDQSMVIRDTGTPANNYSSSGTVSSGALIGPGGKLTYSAPSAKLTLQSDGFYKYAANNLIFPSENFTSTWTNTGSTETLSGTPPAPYTTSYKLAEDTSTGQHNLTQTTGTVFVAGVQYEFTVVAKAVERSIFWIYSGAGIAGRYFDLSNGTVTGHIISGTPLDSTIEPLGDGWHKCKIRMISSSTGTSSFIFGVSTAAGTLSYTGTTGSGVLVTGAQLTRYPVASSDYILTTAAAVYSLPYEWSSSGTALGVLIEEARTNLCLRSNDFTNASWTKSNMTTALTATGPDGVANSASTLTATAGNATALQAITSASATRITSMFVKRRTGTGNIDITQNNGTNWTTVTVTSEWTRVSLASATLTDPTVGIRIVTSGDAVDVAYFQHEVGAFVTSPIVTGSGSVTRAVDNITIATSLFPISTTTLTMYGRVRTPASVQATALHLNEATGNNQGLSFGGNTTARGSVLVRNTTAGSSTTHTNLASSTGWNDGDWNEVFAKCNATSTQGGWNGTQRNDTTGVTVNMTGLVRLRIGGLDGSSIMSNGHIASAVVLPRTMTQAEAEAATV